MISLCTCWRLRFMYNSVLYQWPNQRIEWTQSCTRLRLALWCDLHIYTKGHFHLNRDLMMTDNSCNKFHYRILNFFFLKKEILLKKIMAVHRFGIRSSVWCRAKNLWSWSSGIQIWMSVLFVYVGVLSNRNDLMTFETSIDKINMRIRTVYYRGSLIWVYAYRQRDALCKQAVWLLRFKTAEILISLRFSHLNSLLFTFEERDFCVFLYWFKQEQTCGNLLKYFFVSLCISVR